MDINWGPVARNTIRNSMRPENGYQVEGGAWGLGLPPGPHLFTDWRLVLAGDVWGGFHWASKETGEHMPVRVHDAEGELADGPIAARMVPGDGPDGVRIVAQEAMKSDPFPQEGPPGQVIRDGGVYRTWYSPRRPWERRSAKFEGTVVHAESNDGYSWGEPTVCVFDWRACPEVDASESISVFVDPSAPVSERYKLVFLGSCTKPEYQERRREVLETIFSERPDGVDPTALQVTSDQSTPLIQYARYGAVSPDGLGWKVLPEPLMIVRSDAQNTVYYDPDRESYVWYLKAGGLAGRRSIARAETKDFRRWGLGETIVGPWPELHPSDDWYTNSKSIYPGTTDYHLMFPALYHHATDSADLRLFSSPDGVSWSQVPGGPVVSPGEQGGLGWGFSHGRAGPGAATGRPGRPALSRQLLPLQVSEDTAHSEQSGDGLRAVAEGAHRRVGGQGVRQLRHAAATSGHAEAPPQRADIHGGPGLGRGG